MHLEELLKHTFSVRYKSFRFNINSKAKIYQEWKNLKNYEKITYVVEFRFGINIFLTLNNKSNCWGIDNCVDDFNFKKKKFVTRRTNTKKYDDFYSNDLFECLDIIESLIKKDA